MTADVSNDNGYPGQVGIYDFNDFVNALDAFVWSILARCSTMKQVKVMAVQPGALGPVGFVDVQPLVNQIDGLGNASPHGTLYKLPYTRMQGGKNAVILDPVVGDLGWAVFADRDSSIVKTTKDVSNPGSKRRFDLADGVYIGGILNGTPDQYVQFKDTGILIADKNSNTLEMLSGSIKATTVLFEIDGSLKVTGAVNMLGTFHAVGAVILDSTLAVAGALSAASATISGVIHGVSLVVTTSVTAVTAAFSGVISVIDINFPGLQSYVNHFHGGVQRSNQDTNTPS